MTSVSNGSPVSLSDWMEGAVSNPTPVSEKSGLHVTKVSLAKADGETPRVDSLRLQFMMAHSLQAVDLAKAVPADAPLSLAPNAIIKPTPRSLLTEALREQQEQEAPKPTSLLTQQLQNAAKGIAPDSPEGRYAAAIVKVKQAFGGQLPTARQIAMFSPEQMDTYRDCIKDMKPSDAKALQLTQSPIARINGMSGLVKGDAPSVA